MRNLTLKCNQQTKVKTNSQSKNCCCCVDLWPFVYLNWKFSNLLRWKLLQVNFLKEETKKLFFNNCHSWFVLNSRNSNTIIEHRWKCWRIIIDGQTNWATIVQFEWTTASSWKWVWTIFFYKNWLVFYAFNPYFFRTSIGKCVSVEKVNERQNIGRQWTRSKVFMSYQNEGSGDWTYVFIIKLYVKSNSFQNRYQYFHSHVFQNWSKQERKTLYRLYKTWSTVHLRKKHEISKKPENNFKKDKPF